MAVMRMEPARHRRAEGLDVSALRQGGDIAALIGVLRRHIARLETGPPQFGGSQRRGQPWRLGLAEIDRHLPEAGLPRHGLHDIAPLAYGDMPAAMGFALAL
ncbi:MAG: hypothetical protein KDK89_15380, partial [Alphaproteobacteria bacterium]|nr:hypothetical protein [Alphaproteobacteria bacterium]